MIQVDCKQGTDEWHRARLGIPTASNFGKILTPTGRPSTQADTYRMKLLAEWLTGEQEDEITTYWMQRGYLLQPEALKFYELHRDVVASEVGLCYLDDRRVIGASPDGLIGEEGGLEIKCPSGGVHLRFLMTGSLPSDYIPQVQGNLYVTGREWWDFVSYHPQMPSDVIRIERDERYIGLLASSLDEFVEQLMADRAALLARGFAPAEFASEEAA